MGNVETRPPSHTPPSPLHGGETDGWGCWVWWVGKFSSFLPTHLNPPPRPTDHFQEVESVTTVNRGPLILRGLSIDKTY